MSAYGYTPPQWSQRRDQGFVNHRGAANNRNFLGSQPGQPGFVGPVNRNPGPPGTVAQQQQRFMQTLSGAGAQGYSGGYRDSQNRTIGLDANGNPSANFGGFAGIQNYLTGLGIGSQAYQQGAAYLRQNGLMPTYNGIALDRLSGAGSAFDLNPQATANLGGAAGFDSMGNPTGAGAHIQGMMQSDSYYSRLPAGVQEQYDGRGHTSYVQNVNGRWVPYNGPIGQQGSQQPQGFGASAPGMGGTPGGYNPGSSGPTGLPLEGDITNSIRGILANGGSPFSGQQQQYLRNQSTEGIDQQYGADLEAMQADAVRRGLNPNEIQGSQRALAQGARNARQQAINNFDIGNAQASMGNRLSAIGAGTGLLGTQISNEDSIRRYYAMLGAAQNGAPMFLGG